MTNPNTAPGSISRIPIFAGSEVSTVRNLLIVDDDPLVQRVIKRTFSRTGWVTKIASSHLEAFAAIAEDTYPVVISDYRMDGMNGLDLLKEIKLRSPDTVMMLMSGSACLQAAVDAVAHRWLFEFIVKPWSQDQLMASVHKAFEQYETTIRFNKLTQELGDLYAINADNLNGAGSFELGLMNGLFLALVKVTDISFCESPAHSRRLALFARLLCEKLGMVEKETQKVICGALLHDLGNIAVPSALLRTENTLTDIERALMQQHPVYGYYIVRNIGALADVPKIVLDHHERWDGQGYPSGLQGEEIHLGARILSVVDAYDSMMSDRPHREALSVSQVNEQLKNGMGSQFEPRIVEAWLDVPDEEKSQCVETVSRLPGSLSWLAAACQLSRDKPSGERATILDLDLGQKG